MRLQQIIKDIFAGNLKFKIKLERVGENKNRTERIKLLAEMLVDEFDTLMPKEKLDMKSIDVNYDYSHHEFREIHIANVIQGIRIEKITKKRNKNYVKK